MGKLIVVVGGQYGSEGKGRAVQALAQREVSRVGPRGFELTGPLVVRVGGPNAGHCVTDRNGNEHKLRQLPAAAVVPGVDLAIGQGSEVNLGLLSEEIIGVTKPMGPGSIPLHIDQSATLMEESDSATEGELSMNQRIGSTQSGVGEARIRRTRRVAQTMEGGVNVSQLAMRKLWAGSTVIVEGTQGLGLGLHYEHYPQCTSIDCTAVDMLAMAGIVPWNPAVSEFEVWVVLRTRPIRVAGNSGPLYGETDWERVGVEPEVTTVTKRERRVGSWDPRLAFDAIRMNGGPQTRRVRAWLSMLDYEDERIAGADGIVRAGEYPVVDRWARTLLRDAGTVPSAFGTGKTSTLWADPAEMGWYRMEDDEDSEVQA